MQKTNSNCKVFVNIVKYKLDHMRKKMETEERDATSRSSFRFKIIFFLRNRNYKIRHDRNRNYSMDGIRVPQFTFTITKTEVT